MNNRAQSGLEYLMTYGWALVLIAAIIGSLVFIVGSPASDVTFSSSDPTKIMIKSESLQDTTITVILQNITGGNIEITGIIEEGYSNCTIDGGSPLRSIRAGSQMVLECTAPEDSKGTITLQYTNFASLQKSVVITGSMSSETGEGSGTPCVPDGCNGICPPGCTEGEDPDCSPSGCCGNGILEGSEVCDSTQQEECSNSPGYYFDNYVKDGLFCNPQFACDSACIICIGSVSCNGIPPFPQQP